MRKIVALALVPVALLASAGSAFAQTGVETVVGATVGTGGVLSILGTGVSVTLADPTPGSVTTGIGATALTVEDLRGTDKGWSVTATYSDVATAGTKSLGASNVFVTASGVKAGALGGLTSDKVTLKANEALTEPVTVATTGANDGSGVTAMTATLGVRMPVTAKVGEVYGGKVTYTVTSVR